MNFDQPDRLDILPQQGLQAPPGTLRENLKTAFDVARYNGGSGANSKAFTMLKVWDPIVELANQNGGDFENPGQYLSSSLFDTSAPRVYERQTQELYSWLAQNKESLPPELQDITPDVIDQRTKDFVQSQQDELAELARTNPDLASASARFIGSMGSAFGDPVTQATMPFGGWSKSFWKNVMQSAAINAGVGAITEVDVAKWYNELDLEYSYQDFLANVAIQGAFGAALPVAGRGIRMTAEQAKKGWEVLSGKGRKPISPEDQALVDVLEAQEEVVATNPLETPQDPNVAEFEHQSRLTAAQAAIENNQAPKISPEPNAPIKPAVAAEAADNLDGVIFKYDPDEIGIDAKTFQFKSGGDEFGVTERLQDAVWDKNLAGTITVYEYADGRVVVSDGHQRLGLAKRIKAQDPSQEITLYAYKDREVDGISPAESRVSSAIKNIANAPKDSYDPQLVIDAAKVLREATNNPNISVDIISSLPPRSQLVKQAQGVMLLGDDAFMAIVNGVIPPNYAAIVGRLIDDPDLQSAAVSVLAKSNPSNAFEAEAIVRQVRESDFEQVEQIDLFGEKIVTESYFVERAKILDKAYKELRKDKAAFETLVRNSDRLEAEGNVLVKDANKRKADTDGQTIALLQTLANRKGPLSDALNQAARTARDTNSYVEATRGFLDSVRGAIESGDFERLSSGDIGRAVDGTPQIARSEIEKEPALEGFDEPTGVAAERQADQLKEDLFGTPVAAPVLKANKEIEADLKARQPVETVDDIYKIADESQAFIANIGADLEASLGVKLKNPGLKKIETAREKMTRKSYVSANEMTDISRAGFIANKAEDADAIAARFSQDAEILDEGWNVTEMGYFDRKILVRTPNGLVSEIQIWSPKLYDAKFSSDNRFGKSGQDIYTEARDPNTATAQRDELIEQQKELYAEALGKEDQSFLSLTGMENVPKRLSNADLNAISEATTRPESATSRPSTATQLPPGSRIATALVGEKEIAGRPSQSLNIIDDTSTTNVDIQVDDVKTGNLFDDMDLEVPLGERLDPDTNEVVPTTMTLKDVKAQMDQEDAMIARLEFCTI